MKIGIGITRYLRGDHIKLWLKQIEKYCIDISDVYIADDTKERKGIAYRKNECLRALKHCDYVFLFDDDTFPIKEGFAEFFIQASNASGQQHFMYLKETPTIKQIGKNAKIDMSPDANLQGWINIYDNCSGCMMFLTKEAIEKVGAFNPNYGLYGYEHAGYSNRIHQAGLTPLGAYTCPEGAGEYIYAMDYDFYLPFNKEVNHKPSIDIKEALQSIEKNKAIYLQDTEIYIPL